MIIIIIIIMRVLYSRCIQFLVRYSLLQIVSPLSLSLTHTASWSRNRQSSVDIAYLEKDASRFCLFFFLFTETTIYYMPERRDIERSTAKFSFECSSRAALVIMRPTGSLCSSGCSLRSGASWCSATRLADLRSCRAADPSAVSRNLSPVEFVWRLNLVEFQVCSAL